MTDDIFEEEYTPSNPNTGPRPEPPEDMREPESLPEAPPPVIPEERLAKIYAGMLISADMINSIIAGTYQGNESAYEQKKTLKRSVEHLNEVEQEHIDFGDRDLTAIHAAIAAGNAFLAE